MWAFTPTLTATSSTGLWNAVLTQLVFTGTHLGKGMVGSLKLDGTANVNGVDDAETSISDVTTWLTDATTGVSVMQNARVRSIIPPTGGVMQFKGLANGTVIE